MTAIRCNKSSDIPKESHYAILEYRDIAVPGYDHGDPNERITVCDYIAYTDVNEWRDRVAYITKRNELGTYVPMVVKIPTIETKIDIFISED